MKQEYEISKAKLNSYIKKERKQNSIKIDIDSINIYEKQAEKSKKRQLGTLEGKMSVNFSEDFALTDEELLD